MTASTLVDRLRRPRTLLLLALLVLLIALRVALPAIVRSVAVSQADAALVGRITLADVDLSLLRGGIALHGIEVYADELPVPAPADAAPADVATADAAPHASPDGGEAPAATVAATTPLGGEPVAKIGRLWVRVGWLPLLRKTVDVAEVAVDDFTVRLDRAQDGALVLPQPVPSEAPPEPEPAPAEEGSGWAVRVSSVQLRHGLVGFRDFAADPEPKPFELAVEDVTADNLRLTLGDAKEEPGRLRLQAKIGEGRFALDAQVAMLAAGPRLDSQIQLQDLPIQGTRVYLKALGWSELNGVLDAELQHSFETGGAHSAAGKLALRDLAITVPDHEGPALAWKRLDVVVAGVDVVARDAGVSSVVLDGLRVPVRPNDPAQPLPVLHAMLAKDAGDGSGGAPADAAPAPDATAAPVAPAATNAPAATEPPVATAAPGGAEAPAASAAPAAAAPAAAPPEAAPAGDGAWTWHVDEVRLTDAVLDVLRGGEATPFGLALEAKALSSDPSARSEIALHLTPPEGTLDVAGGVVQRPLAFDGTLRIAGLSLPKLLAPIEQPAAALVRGGVLDADLTIAVGPPSAAGEQAARVNGTLGLAGLDVGEPPPAGDAFGVGWKSLAVDVREVVVPAALGGGAAEPIRATLDSVKLVEPAVRVTRTERGILLPAALGGAPADEAQRPAAAPTPATAATPTPAATPAAAQASAAPLDLRVAQLTLERGRVQVEDRAVRPTYRSEVKPLDVRASGIRWPGPTVDKLRLDAETKGGAKLAVSGALRGTATELTTKLDRLPLAPLNPYAAGTGYGLGGGSVSLESKLSMKGDAYDASNRLVLSQLALTGDQGEALFQQQFGVPLSLALALLTDLEGNIALDIPVSGDRSGTSIGLASIVGQALAKAILGAVTSPLKMIMAVGTAGGKVESATPQTIQFRPGRPDLASGGDELLEQLAALLQRSPGLRIELQGRAGAEDERWLREQALREQIEQSSGIMGSMLHVGELGEREAVLPVLEKRAHDEPAEVPPEVKDWFEAQVAEQEIAESQITELAEARAELVRANLAEQHGIAGERVTVGAADASPNGQQAPEVALQLGAASGASLGAAGAAAPAATAPPAPPAP